MFAVCMAFLNFFDTSPTSVIRHNGLRILSLSFRLMRYRPFSCFLLMVFGYDPMTISSNPCVGERIWTEERHYNNLEVPSRHQLITIGGLYQEMIPAGGHQVIFTLKFSPLRTGASPASGFRNLYRLRHLNRLLFG